MLQKSFVSMGEWSMAQIVNKGTNTDAKLVSLVDLPVIVFVLSLPDPQFVDVLACQPIGAK